MLPKLRMVSVILFLASLSHYGGAVFMLTGSNKVEVYDGKTATIGVNYTNESPENITAVIYADTNIVIKGTINTLHKNGTVDISPSALAGITYGVYKMIIKLIESTSEQNISSALLYEKNVSRLAMNQPSVETLINTDTRLTASLSSGSGLVIEWISDLGSIVTFGKCISSADTVETNISFPSAVNYTITALGYNSFGYNISDQVKVIVWKPVEGFNFTISSTVVSVGESLTFRLLLDNTTRLPMGNIFVNMSYGDGYAENAVNLNTELNSLTSTGKNFKHNYTTQGNFSISLYVYTSLSVKIFNRTALVWNKISLPSAVSYIQTGIRGVFYSNYSSNTPFNYYISYGDNRTKFNPPGIIANNQPIYTSEWENSFDSAGVYVIVLEGWNPAYFTRCYYTVHVQDPIPDLKLSPVESNPLAYFSVSPAVVTFTLTMNDSNSLPPTNMSCRFNFNRTWSDSRDVELVGKKSYSTTFEYPTVGVKNITVICSNNISSEVVSTRIEILPDIEGFKLTNGYILILTSIDESCTSHFSYDNGVLLTATIKVYANTTISIKGTVDENNRNGSVTITRNDLSKLSYGTYKLSLVLQSKSGQQNFIYFTLIYEEHIQGFKVEEEKNLVLVKTGTSFNVTLNHGSNVEVEIVIDAMVSILLQCQEIVGSSAKVNYSYPLPIPYNVSSVARNPIDKVLSEYRLITVVNGIKGFTITADDVLIDSYTNAVLRVKLDTVNRLPMHDLSLSLDFGDGSSTGVIQFNTVSINYSLSANGFQIVHTYTKQGNFTIKGYINSILSSQALQITIYVWDNITNVHMKANQSAKVNEEITFYFENVTKCGFEYSIGFGDGQENQSASDVLFHDYQNRLFTHKYDSPKVYEVYVKLMNPFYNVFQKYLIIIQHPIVDFYLWPRQQYPPIQYPLPDGKVVFKVNMTKPNPDPTNVTCIFIYENGTVASNDSVNITYANSIERTYNYSTNGTKDILIICTNIVSRIELTTQVDIIAVELDDFVFNYQPVVPMNMTSNATDIPVEVFFKINLFKCVHFPPSVRFEWNFHDDSKEVRSADASISHTFKWRKIYNIIVLITNSTTTRMKSLNIKLGAVDFNVSSFLGGVNITTFTFEMTGIGKYGTYNLYPALGSMRNKTQLQENIPVKFDIIYYDYGKFDPRIVAQNENFTEFLYFPEPLVVDYNLTVLKISMPDFVEMPDPGRVTVTAELFGTRIPLPEMSCMYDMQDFIDLDVTTKTQNITRDKPLIFNYTYYTLGEHSVTVNCSNYYDKFLYKHKINVTNKCFTIEGIFDRQYAQPSTPMTVYTTENFDLTNRMGVHCSNETVRFQWKIYTYDLQTKSQTLFNDSSQPSEQKNRGSYRFSKGQFPEGLYKVALNVTLNSTWIPEWTFLRFVRPPPKAFIEGGFERSIKLTNGYISLDAFTSSYDVGLGYGGNQDLNFTWKCYQTNISNSDDLVAKYQQQKYSSPCAIMEGSPGKGNLTLEQLLNQGYIVTVNVSLYTVFAEYTQLIMAVGGDNPDIYIRCLLNCDIKYAVSAKSIWSVVCIDCKGADIIYRWKVEVQNTTDYWLDVTNIRTETGFSKESFNIYENVLTENKRYRISIYVTDQRGEGSAKWKFRTNQKPYGGICKATNTSILGRPPNPDDIVQDKIPTGRAFSTRFAIYCFNWKDEGDNDERNETIDSKKTSLMYEYVLKQFFKTSNNGDLSQETSIYKGGESTATDLRLPAGSPDNDSLVVLKVKIIDRFGDYETISWNVNVTKDESLDPSTRDGTIKLFQEYDGSYNTTKAGGNDVAVLRLISSTASMYSNIPLGNGTVNNPADQEDLTSYEENPPDEVQSIIQNKTKVFVNTIAGLVPSSKTFHILPADAQLVANTLDECISNKNAIKLATLESVTNTTYDLMNNVKNASTIKPFPMSELGAITGATLDVIDVLSKNLKFMENITVEDLNSTYTLESAENELKEYLTYHPNDKDKYPFNAETIKKWYERKLAIRNKHKEAAESTEKTSDKLFGAISTVNEVLSKTVASGEGERVRKDENMYLSIEKDTVDSFRNKSTIERHGFKLKFDNDTFTNVTDHLDIQVSVLKKSPLLHAEGASKIRGKVMQFIARNDTEEANTIQIPLEMHIQNDDIHFTEFNTSAFENEQEGFMYFRLSLQDTNDAIIVQILPNGFDMWTIEKYNWTLRATSHFSTTVGEPQFEEGISLLSWTPYGFKVFIPNGTFPQGDVIITLETKEVQLDNNGRLSRKKRNTDPVISAYPNGTIYFAAVTTGCRVYDDVSKSWTHNGCYVLPISTINETVCRCSQGVGTIFASSFFAPNLIDFSSVWAKFDINNASVYGTLIALFVLYIIGVIVLRRFDKKDRTKWMPMLLCDNKKSGNYFYLISVYTGLRPGAGTKSNISFIIGGESADSGVRLLSDGTSRGLESQTVKSFIMSTPECLGGLTYFRVWHDNSGEGDDASWYLHKIIVDDLQTKDRFVFNCDRWLALDLDDGMIERLCPVIDAQNAEFNTLFSQQTRMNLSENHLWLSIVVRPQRSLFTRVQRLSCLLSLLLLTMITNAMFFKSDSEKTVIADSIRVGSLRLSFKSLYVSAVGAFITVLPIMLMTYLFKNTKSKKTMTRKHTEKPEVNLVYNKEIEASAVDKSEEIIIEELAKFPHYFVYIAWFVVALSVLVPAFFMLLYSMEWGTSKSEEWLTTFVLSFMESILIVDPMKVLIIALIIAWLIKRPAEDFNYHIDLDNVREKCKHCTDDDSVQFASFRMEIMSKSEPPIQDALQNQRIQRLKEKVAQKAFVEVILQILFATVVFSISYVNRDERAFLLKNHIENHLYSDSKTGFSQVQSQEAFVNWTSQILIPFAYPTSHFNDKVLGVQDKRYVGDFENVRVGMVRLRQVRSNEEHCSYDLLTDGHFCVPNYTPDNENKSSFSPSALTLTTDAWSYTSSEAIWGIDIMGVYNTYSGGGFIQKFTNEKDTTEKIFEELVDKQWIDRSTRAVFVEFSLFNPNTKLFSYSIYLAEFSENGGAFIWADTQCFRASTITDATGAFALILYVVFLIIIVALTVKLINKYRRDGCKATFTQFWNILDIILCTCSYGGVVVWVFKYIYTQLAMKKYRENKNELINFQHIVVWEYIFTCILGGLCFTSTLRILSALAYNKRLTEIAEVLRNGAKPICQFAIVFMCVFFNFVGFGYLLFGSTVYEYKNIFSSFGTLTNTLIGKNSLDAMIRAAPNCAEIYFFVYVFFVIFTLMTMFAAILNESISEVRKEKAGDTIGIVQVVKTALKDVLGVAGIRIKNETVNRSMERYKIKENRTNGLDVSNILGLIRETLDDFEFDENSQKEKKSSSKDNKENETSLAVSTTENRPLTATNVRIVLPNGKEIEDDNFDFYKGYI